MSVVLGMFLHAFVATKRVLSIDSHELSRRPLRVRPYYPSIGVLPAGFDCSRSQQLLPDDVVVDCAPEIVAFLLRSKQHKHKVELCLMTDMEVVGRMPEIFVP